MLGPPIGGAMSPAKPPVAPAAAPPRPPPPIPRHGAIVPKGLPFAHVLAAGPQLPRHAEATPAQPAQAPTALPQAVHGIEAEPDERHHHAGRGDDELDPSARQAAQLAPPMAFAAPKPADPAAAPLANARVSLEDLVPQLVKKIAWSGDAQRGTVRMELGAGELAGATLTVSAEHGRVSVRVDTPPGTDTAAWRERLASRLAAKGIALDGVDVR